MDKNNIVIIEIWEGLGNQLFQYAYGRMLKEKGVDVRLDLGKTYDQYMDQYKNNTPRQIGIQNFNVSLPGIDVEKYGKYDFEKRIVYEKEETLWYRGAYRGTFGSALFYGL